MTIHPATHYILGLWAVVFILDLIRRDRVRCWWIWQGSPVQLGITYSYTHGWPADQEFPLGLGNHHAIDFGVFLFMVRIHWFGRVPQAPDNETPQS